MSTYYFTYGMSSPAQDYCKGWTEVEANSSWEAIKLYKRFHPPREGLLPCCGVALSRDQMAEEFMPGVSMLKEGNGGVFAHDRITGPNEREVFE